MIFILGEDLGLLYFLYDKVRRRICENECDGESAKKGS